MLIKDNDIVLFQGDSITDWGRNRNDVHSLGHGYPAIVAGMFSAMNPDVKVTFYNRGISGNRVRDLKERWEKDCLALQPNVVSIMIGINDTWRRYDGANDYTPVESFKADYHDILLQVKEKTDAKIVLMEPFVLPFPEDRKAWREDLDPKIHAVRELAAEFEAKLVPLDGIFNSIALKNGPDYWTTDGVHANEAGQGVIAKAWLESVGLL